MKPKDFIKIPISQITELPAGSQSVDILRDRWWCVTDDNCVLLYKGYSRQCNSNKEIAEQVMRCDGHPAIKVVFLPIAFFPHNCSDYI